MNFFTYIRRGFIWLTQELVILALDCYDFGWPLSYLGDAFNFMSDYTSYIAGYLWDAANWWEEVEAAIADILSWSNIKSLIRSWLYGIENLLYWFETWESYVRGVIIAWWTSTIDKVQSMIDAAIAELEGAWKDWLDFWNYTWPSWVSNFSELKSAWDNFWSNIFPNLVDFSWLTTWWNERVGDIEALIDTAFALRGSLWEGWQDIKDQVISFFQDPLEWLWGKFADWFLGPEE